MFNYMFKFKTLNIFDIHISAQARDCPEGGKSKGKGKGGKSKGSTDMFRALVLSLHFSHFFSASNTMTVMNTDQWLIDVD